MRKGMGWVTCSPNKRVQVLCQDVRHLVRQLREGQPSVGFLRDRSQDWESGQ